MAFCRAYLPRTTRHAACLTSSSLLQALVASPATHSFTPHTCSEDRGTPLSPMPSSRSRTSGTRTAAAPSPLCYHFVTQQQCASSQSLSYAAYRIVRSHESSMRCQVTPTASSSHACMKFQRAQQLPHISCTRPCRYGLPPAPGLLQTDGQAPRPAAHNRAPVTVSSPMRIRQHHHRHHTPPTCLPCSCCQTPMNRDICSHILAWIASCQRRPQQHKACPKPPPSSPSFV